MRVVRFLSRLFFLAVVTAAFFDGPWCWLPTRTQRFLWAAVATLVFGRFFCDAMCPLGILQTFVSFLFHPKRHVRRVCTRLPETRRQRIVRWSVLAVCLALTAAGLTGVASLAFPLSVYGKALTLWTPGVAVFAVVLALAAVGDGRFWCNWICPFGTVFNLLAKIAPFKNRVGGGCAACGKCMKKRDEVEDRGRGEKKVEGVGKVEDREGVTRRETLRGVAVLAVAEKVADGGFADVSLPGVPDRGGTILPPGAVDRRKFSLKCVGCQLCVANCPGKCLKPSVRLGSFGQPAMDFRDGYCLLNCVKCVEVCPERALDFIQREQRPNVHLGRAEWKRDLCLRATEGEKCTACVRKCPVQAIHLVAGFPVVDREKCIGCGACEHVCPARPMPAIFVKGYEMQRVVNPMSEADLLAEMKAKLDAGASAVVAKGGVIVAVEEGRGLAPALALLDAGRLDGAIVMDKVVGRAAAAVFAYGGVRRVYAPLAAKGAVEFLAARGIPLAAEKTVDAILNREKKGGCPMERAVAELAEPEQMVNAIRKAMKR